MILESDVSTSTPENHQEDLDVDLEQTHVCEMSYPSIPGLPATHHCFTPTA